MHFICTIWILDNDAHNRNMFQNSNEKWGIKCMAINVSKLLNVDNNSHSKSVARHSHVLQPKQISEKIVVVIIADSLE